MMEFTLPFRAYSAANWIAMNAQRHFHEYGTTREQLAWIALNARRNAAGNPNAIYRDPLSLDDYLAARIDLDAVLPVRLRRALRRRHRDDRLARRIARATCGGRRCASRRWAPRCAGGPRGTSSTT